MRRELILTLIETINFSATAVANQPVVEESANLNSWLLKSGIQCFKPGWKKFPDIIRKVFHELWLHFVFHRRYVPVPFITRPRYTHASQFSSADIRFKRPFR